MLKVFSDFDRQDTDSAEYSETYFPYLDRSARLPAQRVREVIESWFAHYPTHEQRELLSRLQSRDNKDFSPAFFELYIHELLFRLGYEVIIHPSVGDGITKSPDFLASGYDEEFYVEVVMPSEQAQKDIVGETFIHMALDKVNEIESEYFFAELKISGLPQSPLPGKTYKNELRVWFKNLDYANLKEIYDEKGLDGMPVRKFTYPGGHISVRPIPKNKNKGRKSALIGAYSMGARSVNTSEAIRKAIENKKSRYGELGKPYILAVNVISMSLDKEDVMNALYGSEQYLVDIEAPSDVPPRMIRAKNGAWSTTKATKVSGILITHSLFPWTASAHNLTLYHNPWAKFPYQGNLDKLAVAEPRADGKVYWIDGLHPRQILGLPEGWPENKESTIDSLE